MNSGVLRLLGPIAVAVMLLSSAAQVRAQQPAELPGTIRVVVPYPAGGPTDFFARIVSNGLKDQLKTNSIVENRPGAGGVPGSSYVGRSTPDGGTLLLGLLGPLAIGPVMSGTPFDPLKELVPIRLVATVTPVMIVSKKSGIKSLAELIAAAKANPGKLNFASAGRGSLLHVLGELLKREASIDIKHVPYTGGAPATTAVVSGEMDILFADAPVVKPVIDSGDVIALAVTSDVRDPSLPNVPTFAESGLPGMTSESWYGVLAPAGTPPAIVKKLEDAVTAALNTPEVKESFAKQGAKVPVSSAAQFSTYLAAQVQKWGKIATDIVANEK
jgi:tripartite-type tricarboxylate transporter receptor subunit TctC